MSPQFCILVFSMSTAANISNVPATIEVNEIPDIITYNNLFVCPKFMNSECVQHMFIRPFP